MAPLKLAARFGGDSDLVGSVTILQQFFTGFCSQDEDEPPFGRPSERRHRENHGGDLPKIWAKAGAISPLTLKSKLAHY
jgi:hypothetical protein